MSDYKRACTLCNGGGWVMGQPCNGCGGAGYFTRRHDAQDPAEADPFRAAVRTVIKAMQSYLPPDSGVSKDQFIAEVIGAVDNPAVFAALKDRSNPPER